MALEPARRLFTVDEYHRMAEAGILTEDDRVELLDGEIVEKVTINPSHASCVDTLNRLLGERVGGRAIVRIQNPVVLHDLAEPEPDLSLARPRDDRYATSHPRPPELLLVIEVADTSADWDRRFKIPRYGSAGVPEAWLVDLHDAAIEVNRGPGSGGYSERLVAQPGETISPQALPDVAFAVGEILGSGRGT